MEGKINGPNAIFHTEFFVTQGHVLNELVHMYRLTSVFVAFLSQLNIPLSLFVKNSRSWTKLDGRNHNTSSQKGFGRGSK